MAYLTVEEVAAYLGRANFKAGDEALLQDVILPGVQDLVDQFCHRTFEAAADSTRAFHALDDTGEDRRTLFLDADLCAITAVVNGDGETIPSSAYTTLPANETPYHALVLKASAGYAWTYDDDPEGAISITGRWAYSTTPPPKVKIACLRFVKHLYRQRDNDATGESDQPRMSESGVWIMPTKIPADVKAYLTPLVKRW